MYGLIRTVKRSNSNEIGILWNYLLSVRILKFSWMMVWMRKLWERFLNVLCLMDQKLPWLSPETFFKASTTMQKAKTSLRGLRKKSSDNKVFFFPRENFMLESFNRKLMRLTEAGISEEVVKSFEKHFYVEEPDDHVVLTLGHLGFGFYIWLGCLGIASTFFVLEIFLDKFLSIAYKFIMRKITARNKKNWTCVDRTTPTPNITDEEV